VNVIRSVQSSEKQGCETQEGFFTEIRPLRDGHGGTLGGQHPDRNLEALTDWVHDRDRTVAPLGPANDLENSATERMERIKDLDLRVFCAQGIVRADGSILTFTAPSQRADSRPITVVGSTRSIRSFCR
jgi:hypothetical protein